MTVFAANGNRSFGIFLPLQFNSFMTSMATPPQDQYNYFLGGPVTVYVEPGGSISLAAIMTLNGASLGINLDGALVGGST